MGCAVYAEWGMSVDANSFFNNDRCICRDA